MKIAEQVRHLDQYRAALDTGVAVQDVPEPLQPGLDGPIPGLPGHSFRELAESLDTDTLETERAKLVDTLQQALVLEHATIPPYLTALYTLGQGSSWQATEALRSVAVEEMLHMTMVANLINALGGHPKTDGSDFIPNYPAPLPFNVDGIKVGLYGFSREAIEQGCAIERPREIRPQMLFQPKADSHDLTIGEFYLRIEARLRYLVDQYGERAVFIGQASYQVGEGFYYDGAGATFPIVDMVSALLALNTIRHQGEGVSDTIWSGNREQYKSFPEVAHYFRFNELLAGRQYQYGDTVESGPTGKPFEVNWETAIPIKPNSKLADYADAPEILANARAFNESYCGFLRMINRAFNGEPALLQQGIGSMFRLKDLVLRLVNNPLPGSHGKQHAAPTFEYAPSNQNEH